MDYFQKYLLIGGLPDAVNSYLNEKNIQSVRNIQNETHDYYAADASKYDEEKSLKYAEFMILFLLIWKIKRNE